MKDTALKTIGILGGMSSVATGEYYNLINEKVKQIIGGHNTAEMIIYSVNFADIEDFIRTNNWKAAAEYLADKSKKLEAVGVTCLFLATNTMHKVRNAIKEATSIPFIDIFETVSKAIKLNGKTIVGILGTYPVMSDQFYVESFKQCGVEIIRPNEAEKKEIDRIIFDELTHHKFLAPSKDYYLKVIENLVDKGAQGIVLGCTEIKMLISQNDVGKIQLFDTTDLHCELAAKIYTGEVLVSKLT